MDPIKVLSTLPADDGNFKSVLKGATENQICIAVGYMEQSGGNNKSRIAACKRELKKRDKAMEGAGL